MSKLTEVQLALLTDRNIACVIKSEEWLAVPQDPIVKEVRELVDLGLMDAAEQVAPSNLSTPRMTVSKGEQIYIVVPSERAQVMFRDHCPEHGYKGVVQ